MNSLRLRKMGGQALLMEVAVSLEEQTKLRT